MQKIMPCLWFDDKAEEAINFYVSVFPNSKILSATRYGDAGPLPKGTVLTVTARLHGQEFMALNGGPVFTFSPAVSFIVNCQTQGEVDHLWDTLSHGGEPGQCGWIKDRFGLTWQIVPTVLGELLNGRDPERAKRVMTAMLQMCKIEISGLKRAYEQR